MKLRRSLRIQSQNAKRGRSPTYTSMKMDKPTNTMARTTHSTKRKLSFGSPCETEKRQKLELEHPSEVSPQEKPKPCLDMPDLSGITPLPSSSYEPLESNVHPKATFEKKITDYIREQNCREPTETFTSNNVGILETLLQQNLSDHDYTNLSFNKSSYSESTLSASESFDSVDMETSHQVNRVFEEGSDNEPGPSNISSIVVDMQVPNQIDSVDMETSSQINQVFEEGADNKPISLNISSTVVNTQVPNQIDSVDMETSYQVTQVFEEGLDNEPGPSDISSSVVDTQVLMETSCQVNQVFEEGLDNEPGPSNISSTVVDTRVLMETSCQVNQVFEEGLDNEPGPSNISSTVVDTQVLMETSCQVNQVFEEGLDNEPGPSNISSTVVDTQVLMETSCQVNQVFEEGLDNEPGPSNISSTVVDTEVPNQIDSVDMETSCQVNQVFEEGLDNKPGPSNISSTVVDTEVPNQIDSVDMETSCQVNQVFEEGLDNKPGPSNISSTTVDTQVPNHTDGAFNEDNSDKENQNPRSLIVFLSVTDTEAPNEVNQIFEEADGDINVSCSETDMKITNETYQAVEEGSSDKINQSFDASPEPSVVFFDITGINLTKIVIFNVPDVEAPSEDAFEKADSDKGNDAVEADMQTPNKPYHHVLKEADPTSSNNTSSLIDLKISNQNKSYKENRSIEGPSNMFSTEADMEAPSKFDQPFKQDGLDKENKNYSPKENECAGKVLVEESSVTNQDFEEDDSDKENQSSCANKLRRPSKVLAKSEDQETGEVPVDVELEEAALPDDLSDITVRPELYYNIFNIGLEILLHVYGVNGTDTFDGLNL